MKSRSLDISKKIAKNKYQYNHVKYQSNTTRLGIDSIPFFECSSPPPSSALLVSCYKDLTIRVEQLAARQIRPRSHLKSNCVKLKKNQPTTKEQQRLVSFVDWRELKGWCGSFCCCCHLLSFESAVIHFLVLLPLQQRPRLSSFVPTSFLLLAAALQNHLGRSLMFFYRLTASKNCRHFSKV